MTTTSKHNFGKVLSANLFDFCGFLFFLQNIEEEYGMFVWPCSIVLAEYVWQQKSFFTGKSVLELGAGISLPGLVAAKVGSNVTLTDDSSRREGEWDLSISNLQPSIILGDDILYDSKGAFAFLNSLLQNTPGSVFITTYHNRRYFFRPCIKSYQWSSLIEYLMVKWSLKCTKLLDAFSCMPSCKCSTLTGNIQLVEIVGKSCNN
ncbi:hypothetical protein MKW94_017763 [Papaver nudicaule]|uniref:Methyltransferase-like protein 23 n=1 Tax=Papaver nudicaule TaxID=74823 RepID=A0AA41V8P9_PAPNU|nr:hypothetical protein [Papaver nudicaule]